MADETAAGSRMEPSATECGALPRLVLTVRRKRFRLQDRRGPPAELRHRVSWGSPSAPPTSAELPRPSSAAESPAQARNHGLTPTTSMPGVPYFPP